jgi:sec-independent protein translocase protein TatA
MGIGFKELLIILVIVLVLFGAKRLRNIGSDLGAAIKGFRKSVREGEEDEGATKGDSGRVIEGEHTKPKDAG